MVDTDGIKVCGGRTAGRKKETRFQVRILRAFLRKRCPHELHFHTNAVRSHIFRQNRGTSMYTVTHSIAFLT